MRYLWGVIFLLLTLQSCSSKKERNEEEDSSFSVNKISVEELVKKKIPEEAVWNSLSFVRLETTDKVLIKQIEQIRAFEDRFYILDNQERLFVFDREGRFVRYIGNRGPGPEEYSGVHYFYIHPTRRIIGVIDAASNSFVRYTLDGEFVDRGKLNIGRFMYTQVDWLDESKLLLYSVNHSTDLYSYLVVNERNMSACSKELPFWGTGEERSSGDFVNFNSGKVSYVTRLLSDTIYRWTGEEFMPYCVLDSGLKHITKDEVEKNGPYSLIAEAHSRLRKQGYSPGIDKLCSTDDYLYLEYSGLGYFDAIFWNLKNDEGALFRCPLDANILLLFYHNLMCTSQDALVRYLTIDDLYFWEEKIKSSKCMMVKELYHQITPDDNPVLLLYDYKKIWEGVKP